MLTFSMLTSFPIEWQILDRPQTQYDLQTNIIFLLRKRKYLCIERHLCYIEKVWKSKRYLGMSPLDRETVKTK